MRWTRRPDPRAYRPTPHKWSSTTGEGSRDRFVAGPLPPFGLFTVRDGVWVVRGRDDRSLVMSLGDNERAGDRMKVKIEGCAFKTSHPVLLDAGLLPV